MTSIPRASDMREPMFYCRRLPAAGEIARLNGDEAGHASGSRRLKAGDTLWLFDGCGGVARVRLHALHDRGRELETIVEECHQQPPPWPTVHLACAPPKGERAAVLLDMATQLGVSSFTPLVCERGIVKPGQGTLERWRRVCLEACKQSRRAHLPEIHAPATLAQLGARGGVTWIAHPHGAAVTRLALATDSTVTLLVGPEGGFTDEEMTQTLARGATRVTLGAAILRVETAAVALLGMAMLGVQAPRTPG